MKNGKQFQKTIVFYIDFPVLPLHLKFNRKCFRNKRVSQTKNCRLSLGKDCAYTSGGFVVSNSNFDQKKDYNIVSYRSNDIAA